MISPAFPGILRVWDVATAACVHTQPVPFALQDEPSERSLSQCQFVPARNEILTVSVEHNIIFYDAQTLQLRKQVTTLSLPFPLSRSSSASGRALPRGALGSRLFWNCSREFHWSGGMLPRDQHRDEKAEQTWPEMPLVCRNDTQCEMKTSHSHLVLQLPFLSWTVSIAACRIQ